MFYNILLYLEKIKFIPITGNHKNKLDSFRGFECRCFVCVCVRGMDHNTSDSPFLRIRVTKQISNFFRFDVFHLILYNFFDWLHTLNITFYLLYSLPKYVLYKFNFFFSSRLNRGVI